jgi:hypothetical protein
LHKNLTLPPLWEEEDCSSSGGGGGCGGRERTIWSSYREREWLREKAVWVRKEQERQREKGEVWQRIGNRWKLCTEKSRMCVLWSFLIGANRGPIKLHAVTTLFSQLSMHVHIGKLSKHYIKDYISM